MKPLLAGFKQMFFHLRVRIYHRDISRFLWSFSPIDSLKNDKLVTYGLNSTSFPSRKKFKYNLLKR